MREHLAFDFTQAPERNPGYFFPLDLKLVPSEKQRFIEEVVAKEESKFRYQDIGLANVSSVDRHFKQTREQTESFVRPLGLKVNRTTFFMSSESTTSWVIHADGVNTERGNGLLLEARLSYYEIAEAPGAIRWWNNLPMTRRVMPADGHSQERVNYQADCAEDLQYNRITWADVPAPDFSVVTSVPSAILKTNIPHHVIQGPGLRVTVSFQLVFENGDPEGVWQHLQNNIHLLGA